MSPVPLIELQRRLSLVGAIRAGGERPKSGRAPGKKLEAWRITSPRQPLIEQAASLYGGTISPWEGPNGREFQVYTDVDELPVLVMPSYSLRQTYELWEGVTKRMRLCDGVDEELSGAPCICNQTGDDKCDVYTRLVVALPELDTVLGWRLISKGINAAHELPAMIGLIQHAGGQRTFVPARLRLEQRRGVVDGQVARFVVPTLDLGVGYLALASGGQVGEITNGTRELPPAETMTTATKREPTVDEALAAVDAPPTRTSRRRAAPHGVVDVDVEHVVAPTPPAEPTRTATATVERDETGTVAPTPDMKTKLNVLVGTLREAGHVTTESLYEAVGTKLRRKSGEDLALMLGGYDEQHVLHWSPLRDALTRSEAHQLIDWLVEKERRVKLAGGSGDEPERPASTPDVDAPTTSTRDVLAPAHEADPTAVPFGEFPPGY
jgi:hypothetical protein